MILLIDNYDSFTYNLCQYLRMLGREVVVRRNDEISVAEVERLNPSLIVISPGPGSFGDTGVCVEILDAFHRTIPMLGICLGMQTIAAFFGGRIVEAIEPAHGKMCSIDHDGVGLFWGLRNPLEVTRYHSLVVEEASFPDCLEVSSRSKEREIMGLRHREYPLGGVQFHPEAYLTQQGMELLKNALEGRF